ncbi:MAG: XRE family transcriptional regulator [Alphaproteobacteria bacterium CG11_big_fil_rev_8_21_14_0_20_39_49]|nr:MAG: XRE family transcriptional regulator [Alphaproteobacteria bacterium CG11_big_fil_rev_8_21_14_0_20_39_49]
MSDKADIFAERLKYVRGKVRGLSQGELAEKTGLKPSAISHFETGGRKASFDNLRKLANALDVTIDYLLGRSDDPAAHGEVAAKLARHVENFSSDDMDLAENFLKMLSERKKNEDGK